MSRRKQQSTANRTNKQQRQEQQAVKNDKLFRELIQWFIPPGELFHDRLRDQFQLLAEDVGGERFSTRGWVLIGFDGSRVSAPRTQSNERAFCAPNYGKGKKAKYGKKKSKGMRRTRNKQNPPQPPKPQAWITMMWHMSLRLPWSWRLVQVTVGKTKMWILTSVLSERKLSKKQITKFYKMRWGIEVEFRGLKQTLDKHTLKCRNSDRLLVELAWSIRAMAVAELIALREQMSNASERETDADYDPQDRSLANTMRALRVAKVYASIAQVPRSR